MSLSFLYRGEKTQANLDIHSYECHIHPEHCILWQYVKALVDSGMLIDALTDKIRTERPRSVFGCLIEMSGVSIISLGCNSLTSDRGRPCGTATIVDL